MPTPPVTKGELARMVVAVRDTVPGDVAAERPLLEIQSADLGVVEALCRLLPAHVVADLERDADEPLWRSSPPRLTDDALRVIVAAGERDEASCRNAVTTQSVPIRDLAEMAREILEARASLGPVPAAPVPAPETGVPALDHHRHKGAAYLVSMILAEAQTPLAQLRALRRLSCIMAKKMRHGGGMLQPDETRVFAWFELLGTPR